MTKWQWLKAAPIAAVLVMGSQVGIAQTQQAPKVIATVAGQEITDRDFEQAYGSLPAKLRQSRTKEELYPHVLELLVQQIAVVSSGRAVGIADSPYVQQQLKALENRLVHDIYVREAVRRLITEEMLREEYNRYITTAQFGEEVKARHILLDTKAEAEQVIALMGQGNDFASLAQQYSKGSSAPSGGDLGYFPRGQMVQEFEDVAFGMQPNTYTSSPIQTKFGWHVILVEDKRQGQPPSFEQMLPRLQQVVGEALAFQVVQDAIKKNQVQRYDLQGNPIDAPASDIPELRSLLSQ
ncbi:peptidylprolyl isomerase [Curvivirga sp.]|uniref:peptidylprolyl isomerase n=1 Tax=Curvivirga sp. TaxID=2856848 RepID=UPI003B5BB533